MGLKGDFQTLFLASILQLLCNEGKTGLLKATSGKNEVNVYISKGEIICATASHKDSRLGSILRRHKVITEKQLLECLAVSKERKSALGKVLFEKGYISENILTKFINIQAEEIVFNMLLWKKGEFEYEDCELNLEGMVITHLNVMKIILGATRRIDEMSVLVKLIPKDSLLFRASNRAQENDGLELDSKEWRILKLVDGTRTVRQLIADSGTDEFNVYKILYSLVSSGLIKEK